MATVIEQPKTEQVANVEKKTRAMNKMTVKAHLNFNVNMFRNWMKQKLRDDGKMFDNNGKMSLPKLSGSHIALTAMNEKLCFMILEKVVERLTKDNTGLYNIKYQDLADVIKVDTDLKKNIYQYLEIYDNTLNYKDQYCIDEKIVKKYIDKTFSESIDINNDAFNLLVYILLKSCVRVVDTAFIMIQYAKKRSLNPNVILSSVLIHFNGTMGHLLKMSIDEAIKLCGKDKEDKEEETNENKEAIKEEEKKEETIPVELLDLNTDSEDEPDPVVKKQPIKKEVAKKEVPKKEVTKKPVKKTIKTVVKKPKATN